jgi:hypothetical protein
VRALAVCRIQTCTAYEPSFAAHKPRFEAISLLIGLAVAACSLLVVSAAHLWGASLSIRVVRVSMVQSSRHTLLILKEDCRLQMASLVWVSTCCADHQRRVQRRPPQVSFWTHCNPACLLEVHLQSAEHSCCVPCWQPARQYRQTATSIPRSVQRECQPLKRTVQAPSAKHRPASSAIQQPENKRMLIVVQRGSVQGTVGSHHSGSARGPRK